MSTAMVFFPLVVVETVRGKFNLVIEEKTHFADCGYKVCGEWLCGAYKKLKARSHVNY